MTSPAQPQPQPGDTLPADAIAYEPIPCEHYWASHHEPGHVLYWVRQCMICHTVDWNDLDAQVAALRAQGAADEREACAKLAEEHGVLVKCYCHVASDGGGNFHMGAEHQFADLIRARTTP